MFSFSWLDWYKNASIEDRYKFSLLVHLGYEMVYDKVKNILTLKVKTDAIHTTN